MAWSNEKLQSLLDSLLKIQEDPENKEEHEKKSVKLLTELLRARTSIDPSAIDMSNIIETLDFKRKSLIIKKDLGVIEGEIVGQMINYHKTAIAQIKAKISAMVQSGEYSEQEIKNIQSELRIMLKAKKELEKYEEGMQKGEAVAEQLLASTLGISKNFLGKDGILGSIKGFGKGLKTQLNSGNLAATIALKVFESFMQLDNATTSLFQKTGMTGYAQMLVNLRSSLALTYGPDSATIGADLLAEIVHARRDFGFMSDKEVEHSAYLAGQLGRLGVSVSAFSDLGQFMTVNLGASSGEQEHILNKIYSIAGNQKVSPEKIFREIAQNTPIFARFGRQFVDVYAGMTVAAKRTNVNMETLVALTESTDTTETAFKSAQKFNALLGGNFLNPAALLAATPDEKVKLIAEAYQKANAAMGEVHPRVLRRMYKLFGLDAVNFTNIAKANFEGFEEEVANVKLSPAQKLQEKLKVDIEKSKSAGEKVTNALAKFGAAFFSGIFGMLSKLVKGIVKMVKFAFNASIFGIALAGYQYITGVFKEKKKKAAKKQKALADKREMQQFQENMLKKFEGQDALGENLADLESMQMSADAFLASQGMPLADPVGAAKTETGYLFDIYDQQDAFARKQKREAIVAQASKGTSVLSTVPMYDTPMAMSATNAPQTMIQSPRVKAKFETSSEDDVLLSRLAKLRDKLSAYGEKKTKVKLNVGTGTIAEATV